MSEQQHLCHSGTPVSYWTRAGVWAPYSQRSTPSHKTGKAAEWVPNNPKDPEIPLIQWNMQVTLWFYDTVCAPHIFPLCVTCMAQGGEARKIIGAPGEENSPPVGSERGNKLFTTFLWSKQGQARPSGSASAVTLDTHPCILCSHSSPFTAPEVFLLQASSCMGEVLDSRITKLVIDSLS